MKKIASAIRERAFEEHPDEMQLALFMDNQLDERDREELFRHLSGCKTCREVLKIATQIRKEEAGLQETTPTLPLKVANNIDYVGYLKPFIPFVAMLVLFLAPPAIENTPQSSFKGIGCEAGIIDRSLDYWERKFEAWFGKGEG